MPRVSGIQRINAAIAECAPFGVLLPVADEDCYAKIVHIHLTDGKQTLCGVCENTFTQEWAWKIISDCPEPLVCDMLILDWPEKRFTPVSFGVLLHKIKEKVERLQEEEIKRANSLSHFRYSGNRLPGGPDDPVVVKELGKGEE